MYIFGTLEVRGLSPAFVIQDRMDLMGDEAVTVTLVSNRRHAPLYGEFSWKAKGGNSCLALAREEQEPC